MRIIIFCAIPVLLICCDHARVYEKNRDFERREWLAADQPSFDFEIISTQEPYSLYCNIRSSVSYPYSRIFVNYTLADSLGTPLKKELIQGFLFDQKTGKPLGTSGLGDIYTQQIPLLEKFVFPKPGMYRISFEQFMRTDTLPGVLSVGLRVESTKETQ